MDIPSPDNRSLLLLQPGNLGIALDLHLPEREDGFPLQSQVVTERSFLVLIHLGMSQTRPAAHVCKWTIHQTLSAFVVLVALQVASPDQLIASSWLHRPHRPSPTKKNKTKKKKKLELIWNLNFQPLNREPKSAGMRKNSGEKRDNGREGKLISSVCVYAEGRRFVYKERQPIKAVRSLPESHASSHWSLRSPVPLFNFCLNLPLVSSMFRELGFYEHFMNCERLVKHRGPA